MRLLKGKPTVRELDYICAEKVTKQTCINRWVNRAVLMP